MQLALIFEAFKQSLGAIVLAIWKLFCPLIDRLMMFWWLAVEGEPLPHILCGLLRHNYRHRYQEIGPYGDSEETWECKRCGHKEATYRRRGRIAMATDDKLMWRAFEGER